MSIAQMTVECTHVRRIACLVTLVLGLAAGWPRARAAAAVDMRPLDAELEKVREAFRALARNSGTEVKGDEVPDPLGFLGLDQFESNWKQAREAIKRLVLTPSDEEGLRAYMQGDFAKAEGLFSASLAEKPKRAFPLYLLGCVHFEQDRFGEAASWFGEAHARSPETRSALMLANMSRRLGGVRAPRPEAMLATFDRAFVETLKTLSLSGDCKGLMAIDTTPFTHDPIVMRMKLLIPTAGAEHMSKLFGEWAATDDPDRKMVLTLFFYGALTHESFKALAHESLRALTDAHLERSDFQVVAFLAKYFNDDHEVPEGAWSSYLKELAAVQQVEPDNGFLAMLAIDTKMEVKDLTGTRMDFEPLTAEEIQCLRRALSAKRFEMYRTYKRDALRNERLSAFGGLAETGAVRLPWAHTSRRVLEIARRLRRTIGDLSEAGEAKEAEALISMALTLSGRAQQCSTPSLGWLFAEMCPHVISQEVYEHAARAGNAALIEQFLAVRETTTRRMVDLHIASRNVMALGDIPIRRFQTELAPLEHSLTSVRQQALRLLALRPEHYRKEAIDRLKYIHEVHEAMSGAHRSVVILGMLQSRDALPILGPLLKHPDPLLQRLARRAIQQCQ